MTQEIIKPRELAITPELITIQWEDGHTSPFPHRYLRLHCGCATCVGEWPNKGELDPSTVAEDVYALDHMAVGNYALQFLWSDTHYTGIYPYAALRELCPCPECGSLKPRA